MPPIPKAPRRGAPPSDGGLGLDFRPSIEDQRNLVTELNQALKTTSARERDILEYTVGMSDTLKKIVALRKQHIKAAARMADLESLGLDKIIQQVKNTKMLTYNLATIQDFTEEIEAVQLELLNETTKYDKKLLAAKLKQLKAAQEMSDAQQLVMDTTENMTDPIKNLVKQAKLFTKALLTNPFVMLAAAAIALAKILIDIVKQSIELRKELGLSVKETIKLQYNMRRARIETAMYGAKLEDVEATAKALLAEFGRSDITVGKTLAKLTRFQMTLGVSAEAGAQLLKTLTSVSGMTETSALNMIEAAARTADMEGAIPAQVMDDLAQSTEHFAEFAHAGGKELIRAAIAARKLGIEYSKVAEIGDSLLDIETSIEKQMTASVLLGRNINLERARELAFMGKEDEMLEEIRRQVGERAEFERMNVIQRRALAEAVGMDVASLAGLYDVREEATKQQILPESNKEELQTLSGQMGDLIGLIRQGGVVKMDGKKVGEVIAMAQTPRGM